VVAYWFDFGMSFVGGSIAWRLPIAVQMIFAIVVVALVLGLPESPRWLYKHGKSAEAMDVLCRVYDREPTDEYIIAERDAILGAIELESRENTSRGLLSIFRNDRVKTRQRVILAWLVQFMNQAGGINLVVYYAPCE
jgi:MFS family permease